MKVLTIFKSYEYARNEMSLAIRERVNGAESVDIGGDKWSIHYQKYNRMAKRFGRHLVSISGGELEPHYVISVGRYDTHS